MERIWQRQLAWVMTLLITNLAQAAEDPSLVHFTSTYSIRSGDLLHISVWKETELDRELIVLPDGTVDFPLIGAVKAQGSTAPQLQATIAEKLTPYVPGATVTVIVQEPRGNIVSVIGQVAHPGDLIMNRSMNVMQALSQAGGLTPYAEGDAIVILRTIDEKQNPIAFDYTRVARGEQLEKNITLLPGDVVVVPTASLF